MRKAIALASAFGLLLGLNVALAQDQNNSQSSGYPGGNQQFGPNQEQQFGPGEGQQFGPGGQSGQQGSENGQQFGPSEEQQQKMEKQQKRMQEQGLKQMKQGIKQFAKQITQVEKRVAALEKKGIKAPAELSEAIATAKELTAQISAATDFEEVQGQMEEFQDIGRVIQEQFPQLERLAQFPQVLKKAQSELKRLQSEFKRAKATAARSKLDISDVESAFQEKLTGLQAALTEASRLQKEGLAEEAFEQVEEGFFGQMQDVWEEVSKLQMISNLARAVKDIDRGIKEASATITKLARKKLDVTELKAIVAQAKEKAAEFKALIKAKPVDPDALFAKLDDLDGVKNQFESKVDELTGAEEEELPGINLKSVPQINLDFVEKSLGAASSASKAAR